MSIKSYNSASRLAGSSNLMMMTAMMNNHNQSNQNNTRPASLYYYGGSDVNPSSYFISEPPSDNFDEQQEVSMDVNNNNNEHQADGYQDDNDDNDDARDRQFMASMSRSLSTGAVQIGTTGGGGGGPTFTTATLPRLMAPKKASIMTNPFLVPAPSSTHQPTPSSCFGLSLRAHVVMSPHPSMLARSRSSGIVGPAPLPVVLVFVDDVSAPLVTNGNLLRTSPLIRCGDQVVAVNGISVLNAPSLDYVEQLIGQSGQTLTLTLSPVIDPSANNNNNSSNNNNADANNSSGKMYSSSTLQRHHVRKSDEENDEIAMQQPFATMRPGYNGASLTSMNALKQLQSFHHDQFHQPQQGLLLRQNQQQHLPLPNNNHNNARPSSFIAFSGGAGSGFKNGGEEIIYATASNNIINNYNTNNTNGCFSPSVNNNNNSNRSSMIRQPPGSVSGTNNNNSKLTAFVPPQPPTAINSSAVRAGNNNNEAGSGGGGGQHHQFVHPGSGPQPIMVQVNPQIMLTLNQQQPGAAEIPCQVGHVTARAYLGGGNKQQTNLLGSGAQQQASDQLRIYLSIPTSGAGSQQVMAPPGGASTTVHTQLSSSTQQIYRTLPNHNNNNNNNSNVNYGEAKLLAMPDDNATNFRVHKASSPQRLQQEHLKRQSYLLTGGVDKIAQHQLHNQQPPSSSSSGVAVSSSSSSSPVASCPSSGEAAIYYGTGAGNNNNNNNIAVKTRDNQQNENTQQPSLMAPLAAPSSSSSSSSTSSGSITRRVSFLRATTASQPSSNNNNGSGNNNHAAMLAATRNAASLQLASFNASFDSPQTTPHLDLTPTTSTITSIIQQQQSQIVPAMAQQNANLQASSVKKLKKLLGAGTPDILQAKNLTQRYAELLPIATLKGNAQVKLVSSHRSSPSSLSSSSSSGTFVTWQPAFLAIVRRTLHIFLLSRPPGLFIPAEIALSLFAFSLDNSCLPQSSSNQTQHQSQSQSHHHHQQSMLLTSNSSSSSSSSLVLASEQGAALNNSSSNMAASLSSSSQLQSSNSMSGSFHHRSSPHQSQQTQQQQQPQQTPPPYIILKPSIVSGGVHEALALDWDPMAWEYWILIDSDQDITNWIDCLQQVQRTTSHQPTSSSESPRQLAAHDAAPSKTSNRSSRYQKRSDSNVGGKGGAILSQDDLALGGGSSNSTAESTRRIINDLKRWKMRLGGRSFRIFQQQPSSSSNSGRGDDPNGSNSGANGSGGSSGAAGSSSQQGGCASASSRQKPLGVYLASCEPSTTNQYVPAVVELCVAVIEARGLDTVGVYRVPGNNAAVTALWESVVVHGIENVNADDSRWSDIHVVGSLLKSFFRKLSEPLFPYNVYRMLMSANRQPNGEKRMLSLKRLIHQLPPHHYETLRFLAKHLQVVAANSSRNKMDVNNLAIVFGPTLVRGRIQNAQNPGTSNVSGSGSGGPALLNSGGSASMMSAGSSSQQSGGGFNQSDNNFSNNNNSSGDTAGSNDVGGAGSSSSSAMNDLVKDTADQCRIVQTIVKHVDWFFAGWEADSQVPTDETSPNDAQQGGVFAMLNATVGAHPSVPSNNNNPHPSAPHLGSSSTSSSTSTTPTATTSPPAVTAPSPKELFVSNILSAGRYFRRRSDNMAANNTARQRVVSLPQTAAPQVINGTTVVPQPQPDGGSKGRSMSLFSAPFGHQSSSSLGSSNEARPISEADEADEAAAKPQSAEIMANKPTATSFVFPPVVDRPPKESRQEWQRKCADGLYAAKLTYIDPAQSPPVVAPSEQPPSPPTSTRLHPARRAPPPYITMPHQPILEAVAKQSVPPQQGTGCLPRSLSLDSIDVFNSNNQPPQVPAPEPARGVASELLMLPPAMGAARSDLQLSGGATAADFDENSAGISRVTSGSGPLKPQPQQQPTAAVLYADDSDPAVRLAKLEFYLNQLAAAEDISFKEARKYGTQRLRLQGEYERLRNELASSSSAAGSGTAGSSTSTSTLHQPSQAHF